jgi:hypothetical protein
MDLAFLKPTECKTGGGRSFIPLKVRKMVFLLHLIGEEVG